MCFGSSQKSTNTTSNNTTSYTPNPAVSSAATQNIDFAKNLQNAGFTPYSGERVADFGQLQNTGFGVAGDAAQQGTNWINNYGNAPASSIPYSTIASKMDPYMSQYVEQALNPQLRLQQQQFDTQNRADNAAATSSGAYGDQRAGIQTANTREGQDAQRQGLIANAYNTAFNTAIGAGAQDVANQNQVGLSNAQLNEMALGRGLGALNSQQGLAQFLQQLGGLQQQQEQAKLNVPYSDYLAKMQYPFLTSQLMNQVIGTGAAAMPATQHGTGTSNSVTSQPDNSGFQLGGSILGGIAGNAGFFPFLAGL